ncbi:hypothetical protein BGZ76_005859 [Entomortierella beljakovae]|nr:hypothetical protein BGZ76_005859 [Entomortierella beljakovae]
MSIVLPQVHLDLRNPYSALDSEYENTLNTTNTVSHYNVMARTMIDDDDLDKVSVSSWSVVNSAYASDNEDDEADEIYIDVSASDLNPLTVSNGDGFTTVTKTMTAASINSTKAQPDVWVVRVSKKALKPIRPVSAAPLLEDVLEEEIGCCCFDYEYNDYNDDDVYSDNDVYMDMTEHELSKSSRAVNLKNIRLAAAYDLALCKAYGYTPSPSKEPVLPKSSASRGRNEKAKARSIDLF